MTVESQRKRHPAQFSTCSYVLGDELPLTVDAGVGALAGNLLLLLGDAAGGRGRPARVQGTWDAKRRSENRKADAEG